MYDGPTLLDVPRLILLNGPPAIRKSTLALRFVHDHPLALCLDIDGIRRLIGSWQEYPEESGMLARAAALAAIAEHLAAGHDVVVPQYLGKPEFVDRLAQTADAAGAIFHEVVLMDS